MKKYVLRLVVSAKSRLHFACTRSAHADPATLRVGSRSTPFPAVGTVHAPIQSPITEAVAADPEEDAPSGPEPKRPWNRFAIFPANLLRGGLRRATCAVVFDHLLGKGQGLSAAEKKGILSLGAYHGMMCGAVTGQPGGRLTLNESDAMSSHPFFGLLGGGPRLAPSTLVINEGWPITSETIAAGIVPETLVGHSVEARAITEAVFFKRGDDVLDFKDHRMQEVIIDAEPAITDWLRSTTDNSAARAAERATRAADKAAPGGKKVAATTAAPATKKSALVSFTALEAISMGSRFFFQIEADFGRSGQAGLGLFLVAVCNWLNGTFGGRKAWGWGKVGVESAELTLPDGSSFDPFRHAMKDAELALDMESHVVAAATDAWLHYADNELSAAQIEHFLRLEEKEEA